MPRQEFFTEIRSTHISAECRAGRHADCDGIAYPKEWNGNQHDCGCSHHLTAEERARRKAQRQRLTSMKLKKWRT
jgi:hypothetical protein